MLVPIAMKHHLDHGKVVCTWNQKLCCCHGRGYGLFLSKERRSSGFNYILELCLSNNIFIFCIIGPPFDLHIHPIIYQQHIEYQKMAILYRHILFHFPVYDIYDVCIMDNISMPLSAIEFYTFHDVH